MVTFLIVVAALIFIAKNFLAILKLGFFLVLALIFMFIFCIGNVWFNIDAGFFIKPLLIGLFVILISSAIFGNVKDSLLNVIASILRL